MQDETGVVTGGVDTHLRVHVAAVVNAIGKILGTASFPVTMAGYRARLAWMAGFGTVARIGVEGTGAYGAGLARHLRGAGVCVIEVNRPDRQLRRRRGKSDTTDAEAAARAVLNGEATVVPKNGDGRVEAIRALRVARRSGVKASTQAGNRETSTPLSRRRKTDEAARPHPPQPGPRPPNRIFRKISDLTDA